MECHPDTAPSQGLISRNGILGLRSPVKLYDGCCMPASKDARCKFSTIDKVDARASYAAAMGRREMQKYAADRALQPQQAAYVAAGASLLQQRIAQKNMTPADWQQPPCCMVEGVLQPSNKTMPKYSSLDRAHSIAVLAMERKLAQLEQELVDSRGLREKCRQQVDKMDASYKQKLRDAQVG